VTHLGQRLSALIDGELDGSERERVLVHVTSCRSCRDEVAALRMIKRRMNAIGEAAAGAGLTGRLMELSDLMRLDNPRLSGGMSPSETMWPPPAPPGGWPAHGHPQHGATAVGHSSRQDQRGGRYFLAGSLAVFLAGLGTAAFIAGGEPQPRAPAPPVTPSVDVLVAPHNTVKEAPADPSPVGAVPWPEFNRLLPAGDPSFLPRRP
jgi:anti-sigma factor RsiW